MTSHSKHLPTITVKTLSNGYSLEFDGQKIEGGFLYFTPDKLLEGFMLHIGIEMTDQLNPDTMADFIQAAIACKDTKSCMKEVERVKGEIEKMNTKAHTLAVRLISERKKVLEIIEDIRTAHGQKSFGEMKKLLSITLKGNATLKKFTLRDFGYQCEFEKDKSDEQS